MAFVLKNQPEGKAQEACTYWALQVEQVCGSGKGSPGDAAMVTLAPLCQDTVQMHGHTCLWQSLPHRALQGGIGDARTGRAEWRLHEMNAGAINSKG